MLATHGGHIEIVKLLLVNGADINAQSEDGTTSVLIAAAGYIVIIFYSFYTPVWRLAVLCDWV